MSSQTITHNQEAAIEIATDPGFPAGVLRFWYKVDSGIEWRRADLQHGFK
jgi:hypothetical protein